MTKKKKRKKMVIKKKLLKINLIIEEQKKVIECRNKNILVSAAAGSGKTAVLVERMVKSLSS